MAIGSDITFPPGSGGGGSSFDPHSPGPIGDVTPGAGSFTALSATGGLTSGASDGSVFLRAPNQVLLSLTNTASSLLLGGPLFYGPFTYANWSGSILQLVAPGGVCIGASNDVLLHRAAANTLGLRNGSAPQAFEVYNTFTDASNYEKGVMRWNANVLEIGTAAAGTGTLRGIALIGNIPASDPGVPNRLYRDALGNLKISL